jgi:hypothetical protein
LKFLYIINSATVLLLIIGFWVFEKNPFLTDFVHFLEINFRSQMHKYTSRLLAFGLVVSSAMALNPCSAQTVNQSSDSEASSLKNPSAGEQVSSETEDKSVLPANTVSQASPEKATVKIANPRIPISSRVFPSMQQ